MEQVAAGKRVEAAAREWLGTRFHHQGRVKAVGGLRGGVDCLGVLVGVAEELALLQCGADVPLAALDVRDYGHFPDGEALRQVLVAQLEEVALAGVRAGDVLLMRFDGNPQHLGIVTDYPEGGQGVLHALASAKKVVEHPFSEEWREKVVRCYRIPVACFRGA